MIVLSYSRKGIMRILLSHCLLFTHHQPILMEKQLNDYINC